MQNSTFPHVEENEVSRLSQLLKRIKVAYKLVVNPKAIVIINNQIDSFQTPPKEAGKIFQTLSMDINRHIVQDEFITNAVNNLVYN